MLPLWQDFLQQFLAELAQALRSNDGLRLLLSLREDYLAAMLPYEYMLGGQSRMRSRLLPFGPKAALEAICEPVSRAHILFEPGAAQELVTELSTVHATNAFGQETTVIVDSIEPALVQIVCSSFWESIPGDTKVITIAQVREYANVDRSLARFFGEVLGEIASENGVAAAQIRLWLQQKLITEHGTRGTAYEGVKDTAGMSNVVVRALADRRILKAEYRAGTRWYELQHDRLINPLRQADAREQLMAARLAKDAGDWDLARSYAVEAMRTFGADELRLRGDAERLLGDVAAECGETAEALKRYHDAAGFFEVLQDSTAVGEVLAAAGQLSLLCGRYFDAMTDLQAALSRVPANLDAQIDLALAMWYLGEPLVSVSVLTTVLSVMGSSMAALRMRGEILADLGDGKGALHDLEQVRRNQGWSSMAARALALALVGRHDDARQEAAQARASGQDSGPLLLRIARVAALRGDVEEASGIARAALAARDPALPRHLVKSAQGLATGQEGTRGRPPGG